MMGANYWKVFIWMVTTLDLVLGLKRALELHGRFFMCLEIIYGFCVNVQMNGSRNVIRFRNNFYADN